MNGPWFAYAIAMSAGWAENVIDRCGGTCQTVPSGCIAYVGACVRPCDCEGTVGVPGRGAVVGIGAMGLGVGAHTFVGMFIIAFPADIVANNCGSDMVVYSSHGTEGSIEGGGTNSGPTLRSVSYGGQHI